LVPGLAPICRGTKAGNVPLSIPELFRETKTMTNKLKAALVAGVLAVVPLATIAPASADFVGVHVGPIHAGVRVGPHHHHYYCHRWGYDRRCYWR